MDPATKAVTYGPGSPNSAVALFSVLASSDTIVLGGSGNSGFGAVSDVHNGRSSRTQQQKLSSQDSISEGFGGTVLISEDTLVVGANEIDNIDSGVAKVFSRPQGQTDWTQQQQLIARDAAAEDPLGSLSR